MSKYVNITVSTSLSTDFFIEVPNDATEEQIKEIAKKEVNLPSDYPQIVDKFLQRIGIRVGGLDTMMRSWNVDELEYIIEDGGNNPTPEGEQLDA